MMVFISNMQKIIKIIIICLFLINLISKNTISCEDIKPNYEEDFIILVSHVKEILKEELLLLVKQEDFLLQFKSSFYYEIIMKEDFVEAFLKQLDLKNLLYDNDLNEIKIKILNEFAIFIFKEQKIYEHSFLNNIYIYIILKNIQHVPEFLYFINYLKYTPDKEKANENTYKGFYSFIKDTKQHLNEYPNSKYHFYIFIDSFCYGFNISFFFYNNKFTIYERKYEHGCTLGWDDFFDLLKSFFRPK